jgi:protein-glutamine gamma-glutamyltransferase
VSFGRQKRLLVGWLALLAPLPLPFSDVIGWPVLAVYTLGVLLFLARVRRDPAGWLPLWGMNVLGLAYLPVLAADMLVLHRGHLVAPMIHLGMFALLVKLFAMVRERDKWQVAIGIFFIFLAAMGTSVHPTIVLYLAAFLVLGLALLLRFACYHVLADFSRDDPGVGAVPLGRLMAAATAFILLLAVPLFATLPRLRSPYIIGRGNTSGLVQEAAGFSDAVTLDSIDQIRTSRAVVMRVQFEHNSARPEADQEMRFKAASYDSYQEGRWRRTQARGLSPRRQGGRFVLAAGEPLRWLHVWLQPLHSRSLPLPVESLQVEPQVAGIEIDQGGAVSLPFQPNTLREYRVGIGDRPMLLGATPAGPADLSLDMAGVTTRIAGLAARVAGRGSAAERAGRLERHLATAYAYSLDLGGRAADADPIESFLFTYKSGQCEYFASAMVLMLRAQGIPARLVTGFLGGEYNPFEGYLILRDSNAHAWVEAWLGDREGWQVFDPTPPAGRPEASAAGFWLLAHQAWDFMQFRWDRYVLTYGFYDQLELFGELRSLWHGLLGMFERGRETASPAGPAGTVADAAAGRAPGTAADSAWLRWLRWFRWSPWLRQQLLRLRSPWVAAGAVGALAALAAAALLLWRRLRPPLDSTLAYRRLRRRLDRAGLQVSPALAPLALGSLAAARFPAAAAATGRVVTFYVRESFGGRQLAAAEREALRAALLEAESRLGRGDPRSSAGSAG